MTDTAKQLGQGAIGTEVSTVYTVPASTTTLIKGIDVANTVAASRKVRVFLVPNGDSPLTSNAMIYDTTLSANGVLSWGGTQILETEGDTIQVQGDDTGMTITVSGVEIT